ncbi:FG-GAP repeat protein, partial [Myxococcota bacterium]
GLQKAHDLYVGEDSGAAYLFDCSTLPCTEVTKLTASDGAAEDWFGWAVSLSGDRALVSAHASDDNGPSTGSAYLYDCSTLPCTETKLTASDGAAGDWFGYSVALSGDRALISAHGDDVGWSESGLAYLFDCAATPCTALTKITASDGFYDDYFGFSVALSGDLALISAPQDLLSEITLEQGSAY